MKNSQQTTAWAGCHVLALDKLIHYKLGHVLTMAVTEGHHRCEKAVVFRISFGVTYAGQLEHWVNSILG